MKNDSYSAVRTSIAAVLGVIILVCVALLGTYTFELDPLPIILSMAVSLVVYVVVLPDSFIRAVDRTK